MSCHRRREDSPYVMVNVSDDSPNGEEHDVQSHMFRRTITDTHDKYCGFATIFTLFKANTKETTKDVAQLKAARHLFCDGGGKHSPQNTFCTESPRRVTAKYADMVTAPLLSSRMVR